MNSSLADSHRDDLSPLSQFDLSNAPQNLPSIRSLPSGSRSHRASSSASSINDELKQFINRASRLTTQLDSEKRRADDAEHRLNEVLVRFKAVNDARVAAIQDSRRANSELEMYKLQLETAQREIIRAQEVATDLETQRFQAERDAAEARSRARRLKEKLLVYEAREEGRLRGVREGLQRGREMGFSDGHLTGFQEGRLAADDLLDDDSLNESIRRHRSTTSSSRHDSRTNSPRQLRTARDPAPRMPTPPRTFPDPPPMELPSSPPPVPIPPPDSASQSGVPLRDHPPSLTDVAPMLTPRTIHAIVPPDNFIPELGADNVIRIPPPHEFSRPSATPEQPPAPQLPAISEPPSAPRSNTPQQRYRVPHHSSPASNSTTLSQFDIVHHTDAEINMRTPMSAIQEVPSPNIQNLSREGSLRRQPSVSGSSVYHTGIGYSAGVQPGMDPLQPPSQQQTLYARPGSVSGSITSSRRVGRAGSSAGQAQRSSTSTLPDINIQPPSRPSSMSTQQRSDDNAELDNRAVPSFGQHSIASGPPPSYISNAQPYEFSNNVPSAMTPVNMPGGLPDSYITRTSYISNEDQGPPVIPNPELMQLHGSDSDAGIRSQEMHYAPLTGIQVAEGVLKALKHPPNVSSSMHRFMRRDPLQGPSDVPSNNALHNVVHALEASESEGSNSDDTMDTLRTESTVRRQRKQRRRRDREEAREELSARMAAQVPLPPSTVHGTPRSAVGRQTPAATLMSRPQSRLSSQNGL